MKISEEGIALIKRFEGLVLETYDDGVGIQTVGYGHTGRFRGHKTVADAVRANGGEPIEITEDEAEELLRADLRDFEDAVNDGIKAPTAQSMFDAFVSLSFNIGANAFRKSTALKRHNNEDYTGAAEAITWWNKAGGEVLLGLVRRRAAEEALYLDGIDEIIDPGSSRAAKVEENSPRRSNPVASRTTAGATTAGAAGATGAGTVLLDGDEDQTTVEVDEEKVTEVVEEATDRDSDGEPVIVDELDDAEDPVDSEAPDTADETPVEDGSTEQQSSDDTDSVAESGTDETVEGTVVTEDDLMKEGFNDDQTEDAIVILAGIIAVLAALWVIFARIDDWRNYRR